MYFTLIMTIMSAFFAGFFFHARDYKMVLLDLAFTAYFAIALIGRIA